MKSDKTPPQGEEKQQPQSENGGHLERLTYRQTPGAMKLAVRSILLSLAFGSLFFFIIPLTSKLFVMEEDTLEIRSLPEKAHPKPIEDEPEEEEEPEPKQEIEKQVEPEIQEVQEQPPEPPPFEPPAAPVNMELPAIDSNVSFTIDNDTKTDINFKQEILQHLGKEKIVEQPKEPVKPIRPKVEIKVEGTFDEDAVDKKAVMIKKVNPKDKSKDERKKKDPIKPIPCNKDVSN